MVTPPHPCADCSKPGILLGDEFFAIFQTEPPLVPLEAIISHPIATDLVEAVNLPLTITCLQVVVNISKSPLSILFSRLSNHSPQNHKIIELFELNPQRSSRLTALQ